MTDAVTKAADPGTWAQFGLAGLVILALFLLVGWVLWIGIHKTSEAIKFHAETVDQMRQNHEKERSEWRDSLSGLADKIADKIRLAILEMGKKD